uniref:FYVE and coiled-coil domain-containing protein 1 n=1 Tax=Lepisosteus oculatus TaxID=7918 RepID=W5N5P0_LEPOC|nr:PREDICTED: FYVE and coiled-coil domain-containing protein 1 isoform X1 [Lepisosteus oculatus]XP_015210331.1 PREDICTED: FYVE and coiled-coil domain-containing protein 1 isoform X1 [Lepisosteus oculatus]XP_015210332.1 PREDICTED: FYVE and coiled-coil domain-containing protein 1 isoform X1 [Lepisosteus oculatus]
MMAASVGESQLQRIIRDLHDAVTELSKEYRESGEPITDDSPNLHKFSYKLEYLLQFDQKEKTTFLGTRKDYWDYFSDCLTKIKGANDGIRFVKSIPEFKTSLGKGRAFIRYSLVHQRLADTLQQCLMNEKVTSDWYYARSPFLKPHLNVDIINHLYELNEVQFDIASRGYDLDAAWPTFARRTLGLANSPSHFWKPPSRSSSISSLVSGYSQAHDIPSSPDFNHTLMSEPTSEVDDLRLELDQSELKQRELQDRIQQLEREKQNLLKASNVQDGLPEHESNLGQDSSQLRKMVEDLQKQLEVALSSQRTVHDLQQCLKTLEDNSSEKQRELEKINKDYAIQLQVLTQELESLRVKESSASDLQAKIGSVEQKNVELLAKLDGVLSEKGQQIARDYDSAQKIHELLDKLNKAEKEKTEAQKQSEERGKCVEKLTEELSLKHAAARESELKLGMLSATAEEERSKVVRQVEDLKAAIEKLQGALTIKEKESSNLQMQLQDAQSYSETLEKKTEELKKKALEENTELQLKYTNVKEILEGQISSLTEQLKAKEKEFSTSNKNVQHLEEQIKRLINEKEGLNNTVLELEANVKEQSIQLEDYKTECTNLKVQNEKFLQAAKRNEDLNKELMENRAALEDQLACLRASEKQLRSQIEDAKVSVDEKEKKLREENRHLDESYQKAVMQNEVLEEGLKKLEVENEELKQEQANQKETFSARQVELRSAKHMVSELEKNITALKSSENFLQEQLQSKCSLLEEKEQLCDELLGKIEMYENKVKEMETEKSKAETVCAQQSELIASITAQKAAVEKVQLDQKANIAKEVNDVKTKLLVTENQLGLNVQEVSRLQAEVLDLRSKVQSVSDDKLKAQAKLDVTEASRDEFKILTEQLKEQIEQLNREHVQELLSCKEKEERLRKEKECETAAKADLEKDVASLKEQLATLKKHNEKFVLENTETKECLHRANTEMAELGIQICTLTSENEDAKQKWTSISHQLQELNEEAAKEMDRLNASMAALRQENDSLQEELRQSESLTSTILDLQSKLEKAERQVKNLQDSSKEEVSAVKFQMSSEIINHQNQIKNFKEDLETVKEHLKAEQEKVSDLKAKVSELKAVSTEYTQQIEEKTAEVSRSELVIQQSNEELERVKESLARAQEALSSAQKESQELSEKLNNLMTEKEKNDLQMSAEIDDLYRTKKNLEERLIELIRDKDALWQKSDALEFEQKLRAEERWLVDKEVNHCLGCQSPFTWWLRRHHCRLCGRIFCYYCSNNFVKTKHSGKKERCCRECYMQHSAVVERLPAAEVASPPETPTDSPKDLGQLPRRLTPSVVVTDAAPKPDDAVFDIITEEEVNGIYDSDSVRDSPDSTREMEGQQRSPEVNAAVGESTPDDLGEQMPTVQDAEICLLKSGELTLTVPLTIETIMQFGEGGRELFIKSSGYSVIPIDVEEAGPTISWVFSSEPKSISFSVVYKESGDSPIEQAKVLIPLTRCNSHKETIQGQLKVRNPGTYMLIFDNSFSRFISKKVLYHLTVEKPIIYDGSDFL